MATEKRLIDAYACPCIKCDRLEKCRPGICESFAEWWFASVDAVEVVRCKDCKFYKDSPMGGKGCHTHYNGRTEFIPKNDNDFCSYGERKDNE